MKLSLAIKTMFRSTGKTLVTFLLITAVTFGLLSQVAEFVVTKREFNRAKELYTGTGSVEAGKTTDAALNTGFPTYYRADKRVSNSRDDFLYTPITSGQIEEISSMKYIDAVDVRYMTAGVSQDYYRPDDGSPFYNYSNRCVIEGTVTEVKPGVPMTPTSIAAPENVNHVYLEDCRILAGNVPWDVTGTEQVIAGPPVVEGLEESGNNIGYSAQMYLQRATDYYLLDNKVSELLLEVQPGGRYVFVCRFEPLIYLNESNYDLQFCFGDSLANDWCSPVWRVDNKPEGYLDTEEFAPLKELIDITNSDMHTFDMVYTENTDMIKRFADGNMVITEGRGIEPEDSLNSNPVCVINSKFANANGLKVGDTLNFNLGTELFEQYKGLGALAVVRERYKTADIPVSLEIVGIYSNGDGVVNEALRPNWAYSDSTVFLPSSFLPTDVPEDHLYSPAEFGFAVSAINMDAFLEETAPEIEAMGLTLDFNDNGWSDVATAFTEAEKLSVVRIVLLAAAMIVADAFAVYLFISRRRKDYGIMRALGTPKGSSGRAVTVPFVFLSIVSIAAGTIIGLIYTKHALGQNQVVSPAEATPAATFIPGWTIAVCAVVELVFILIVTGIMIYKMRKCPPLLLLQGKGRKKRKTGNRGR